MNGRAASRPDRAARRPWIWAILGLSTGALVVLLAFAPARWLASLLARSSDGMIMLVETDGTFWSGTGALALSGGTGSRDRARLPGRVQWRIRPQFTGVRVGLSADCCTRQQPLVAALTFNWNGARLAVANSTSRWPASVLAGLGTPWNTIRPKGEIALETRDLAMTLSRRGSQLSGHLQVTARHLSSKLSTVRPLGSYQVKLDGGEATRFALSTLEGNLLLSGSGSVVAGNLRFRGEAEAAPGLEAQLANLLNLIGSRRGDRAIISFG